jgi:flagellar biosynthetic protein FliR/FlhB
MSQADITIYILVFVRIISFLGVSPLFTIKGIPNSVKAAFGLILSLTISGFVPYDASLLPSSMTALAVAAAGECIFGLVMGFVTNLVFQAIKMSGELMDIQVGFNMSGELDIATGYNVTLLGNITNLVGLVIFFLIDGHHILIESILQSFDIVPLFGVKLPAEVTPYVLSLFIKTFILALKLAAPVIVVIFLTNFTMGLVSRVVPQLNVLMLGLPVKVLVGLLVFSSALPWLVNLYIKAFETLPGDINNLLKLLPVAVFFASGEKTEEPTTKRREDARKKGQVGRSREFVSAVTLIGITLLAFAMSDSGLKAMQSYLSSSLSSVGTSSFGEGSVINLFIFSVQEFFRITIPMFVCIIVLGVVANIAQTGFIFSSEPLKPKLSRINPVEGFKRMFSGRAFIELLKAILNIVIVCYVTISFIKGELFNIVKTADTSIQSIVKTSMSMVQSELVRVAIIVCVLGVLDLIYQKRAYKKELRMTKQEVKEEYKQSEGDPQIRSRIRQKQREMASRRMMHAVPGASVVITNPTHLAVAIKYEQGSDSAPMVVAKGADDIARKIKEIARDNNVPVIENKPIARMLYDKVEINESVPVEMYQAVAEILAMVYTMNRKR